MQAFGCLFQQETELARLGAQVRGLTRRQVVWTSSAGVCIAVGYLCYFAELHAGISSPVAFGFGCAAGITGMLYGLFVFKEYLSMAPPD